MSTSAQGKGLQLMDDMVGKLIRTGLSLRLGGWMRIFRRCLLQEVIATLEVLEGAPSAEAILQRRRAMCMFMRAGAQRKHRAMLACLPNGNWALGDRVQVFVRPGTPWNRVAVALLVAKALTTALAGSNFRIFNRKRWTNNDLAVNQFGLLEACHSLFSRTYRRWLKAVGYSGPLHHMLADDVDAAPPAIPAVAALMIDEGVADDPAVPEGEEADDGAEEAGDGDEAGGGAAGADLAGLALAVPMALPDNADFVEANKQNRAVGARWVLLGCPLRDLILARVTMEPSMTVLRKQLSMGSRRWENDQNCGLLGGAETQRREYRLLICARGELDTLFTDHHMQVFWSPSLFSLVPRNTRNEDLASLAFRMITRVGAEHERMLASRHRKPPFTLFLATQSRHIASQLQELHRDKPCLLDNFSREFLDGHSLDCESTLAILRMIMAVSHVDTALIECWHAWTRRVSTKLGTQTHRPSQADVLARHLAQRLKKRTTNAEMWIPPDDGAAAEPHSADHDTTGTCDGDSALVVAGKRKGRGGGGAWRAHISKKLRGGESDWNAISASFGSRTEEEQAADLDTGRMATQRHKAGLPAFGPRGRDEARARIANEAALFNRLHTSGHATFLGVTDTAVEPSLRECNASNYDHLMKVVRKADFLLAREKKKAEQEIAQAARRFASGAGKEIRSRTIRAIPSLSEDEQKLYAVPSDLGGLGFERMHVRAGSEEVSSLAIAMDTAEGNVFSSQRNLGVGLDGYWQAKMRAITPEEWSGPADKKLPESRCFRAGHCLCTPEGRRLHQFRNKFIAHQKLMTMKGTPERTLLRDGCLVWMLRGSPKESLFQGMVGAEDDSSGAIDEDIYVFWHIPMVLLSPYVPVYHVMACDTADRGEKPAPHTELAVKALQGFEFYNSKIFKAAI